MVRHLHMRSFKFMLTFIFFVFLAPALASAAWWAVQDRPRSWSQADWGSSGLLPSGEQNPEAAIYVMAARTGGMKGAFSVHSWIVTKRENGLYARYDKVGWGSPVRRNHRPADGRWYSNEPYVVASVNGDEAARLIPKIEAAIRDYPYSNRGDYTIWPGPNSNSFVAHVINAVPELNATLPPNAVGRDFRSRLLSFDFDPVGYDMHASIGGLVGFATGAKSGFELHFMGLVAGLDILNPALKIPGFGRVGVPLSGTAIAGQQ